MTEIEGMNEIRIWAWPKYGWTCCDFHTKS